MNDKLLVQGIESQRAVTVAEQVYNYLYQKILTLELPPGSKLSEVDISSKMGVSRQPVREAFFRLSHLGFLLVRPQRATVVRPISKTQVNQSMVVRKALETETVRLATATELTPATLQLLNQLLEQQQAAIDVEDYMLFHALDDKFHQVICEAANASFIWEQI